MRANKLVESGTATKNINLLSLTADDNWASAWIPRDSMKVDGSSTNDVGSYEYYDIDLPAVN